MKTFYIKALKNKGTSDTSNEALVIAKQELEKKIKLSYFKPFEVQLDIQEVDMPITIEDYYTVEVDGEDVMFRGTKGTKQMIRNTGIQEDYYDLVIFLYNATEYEGVANWTYPNPLYNSEAFIEIPVNDNWKATDYSQSIFHEMAHGCTRLCWFAGHAVQDNMDVESTGATQKEAYQAILRQLDRVSPYWDILLDPPEKRRKVQLLSQIVNKLADVVGLISKTYKRKIVIKRFAEAIQQYEGWYTPQEYPPHGSLSFRNKNAGNLRCASWQQKIDCVNDFAVYATYQEGLSDLKTLLDYAIDGQFGSYKPDGTLIEFFRVYAPSSDNNHPESYANFVANYLGVSPLIHIQDLV